MSHTTAPLTLIQFHPATELGVRSASAYCLKAEVMLRLNGLSFETEYWSDPRKAPKGKLPVLRHGDRIVPDSTFIRYYLEETFDLDFDAGLDARERAVADAFVKLCEDHLYWVIVYSRWMEDGNWPTLRDSFFKDVPALIRPLIANHIRAALRRTLHGQGIGRHAREDVYRLAAADLRSLSDFLGDRRYFMGDRPSSADATVYATLASILDPCFESPLKDAARTHENLVDYAARMRAETFGD